MDIEKRLIFCVIVLFCFGFSCNNKIVSYKEDGEVGFECYYSTNKSDTINLHGYINKFSKFLSPLDPKKSDKGIELFYGFHCYECPKEDRYAIFISFNSPTNIQYTKINIEGKFICSDLIDVDSSLFSNAESIVGDFIKRDCLIEGGETSILVIRTKGAENILSYYESIGLIGSYKDASKTHLDQIELVRKVIAISNECTG